jgi:hypothetical protein
MAARFWVGGSGTWNNSSTTNWSATSGGASGASAPTTADTVTFDANSGTAATVSVAATATALTCTVNKADINLNLTGGPTFTSTFTLTTGTITLNSFTLTCLVFASSNTNARTIAFGTGNITLTGTGTVWNTDTSTGLTVTGTPVVNATNPGSIARNIVAGNTAAPTEADTVSFNVTAGTDSIAIYGRGMRDINFTGFSGTWNATGATKTMYGSLTLSTGMTITGGAITLTFAATSGTKTITTNGKAIDWAITFNGVGGTFEFTDALTQGATRTFTVTNGTVKLKNGTTSTVGSFTTGAGTTQRFLRSTVAGSQATISDASGTNTATYLTLQDIAATGGATWNALLSSNNVDSGNNSGWNFGDYASSGLSRGVGLYAGAQGLRGGNSGLWGGFPGLQN